MICSSQIPKIIVETFQQQFNMKNDFISQYSVNWLIPHIGS